MQKKNRKPLVPSKKLVNTILTLGAVLIAWAIVYDDYQVKQRMEAKRQREAEEAMKLSVEYDRSMKEQEGYKLVWNDEFDGNSLDLTKWDYQYGTGSEYGLDGWGNSELEYYTDRPENVRVEDGKLIITAIRETTPYEGMEYTSGRIRTMTTEDEELFSITYGRIEARIKMPSGEGLWPTFWMLPVDDDIYGGWPASGEIDIMQAGGRETGMVEGSLYYGKAWPEDICQLGIYEFPGQSSITDYHTYALDWGPDGISWYVDGYCYYRTNVWFSEGKGAAANYTNPAPFDVPFYILLNLAVGGTYDPEADVSTGVFPKSMEVDYVRVYQRAEGYSEAEKEKEEKEVKVRDSRNQEEYEKYAAAYTDNEFITDKEFATMNTDTKAAADNKDWQLIIGDLGGEAAAAVEELEEGSFARINITAGGNQAEAVQLMQHLPIMKGYIYQVSFDAMASGEREFVVSVGGMEDNSWVKYGSRELIAGTEMNSYSFTFKMDNTTNPASRLEFNLGQAEGDIWIGNVSVTVLNAKRDITYDRKTPLPGGNLIYNGTFDQGESRLAFWHVRDMEVCVPGYVKDEDGNRDYSRKAELTADGENPGIYQNGLPLQAERDYFLRLDLSGEKDAVVQVTMTGADGTVYLDETCNYRGGEKEQRFEFKFSNPGKTYEENAVLTISLPEGGSVKLDNVKMNKIIS